MRKLSLKYYLKHLQFANLNPSIRRGLKTIYLYISILNHYYFGGRGLGGAIGREA